MTAVRSTSVFSALNFTLDELRSRPRDLTGPGWFTVGFHETPDGDPIVGLVYQTDHDASQEYGIADLRTTITTPSLRRFQMTAQARQQHISVLEDRKGLLLSQWDVRGHTVRWGEPIRHLRDEYVKDWTLQQLGRRWRASEDVKNTLDQWRTVKQLRDSARSLNISPLPRTKTALLSALLSSPTIAEQLPDRWAALFIGGGTLLLRAEGNGRTAQVLEKLCDAADACTLGVGDASGPFTSGVFFYDTRDETPQLIEDRDREFDLYEQRMNDLEPIKDTLRENGVLWRGIGNPKEIDGVVKYYVSIWDPKEIIGWLTLSELQEVAANGL